MRIIIQNEDILFVKRNHCPLVVEEQLVSLQNSFLMRIFVQNEDFFV